MRWNLGEREPSIEELLADEIMGLVMRSAGIDAEELRALLRRTARRRAHRGWTDRTRSMCCALA
jgi:hypothetical protein